MNPRREFDKLRFKVIYDKKVEDIVNEIETLTIGKEMVM